MVSRYLQVSVALFQSREDGPVEDCVGSEFQQPYLASQHQASCAGVKCKLCSI